MSELKILNNLIDIGGIATRNNFYSQRKANTYKGAMRQTNIYFKKLQANGFIDELESPVDLRDPWRQKFYKITKSGAKFINRGDEYRASLSKVRSPFTIDHESMVKDVALAFIRLYKDYNVIIEVDRKFGKIIPDLVVSLEGEKKYTFLVEVERKKSADRTVREKLLKYNGFNFERYGLTGMTKVLVLFSTFEYNALLRPMEYKKAEARIERINKQVQNLIRLSKDLPNIYRFIGFPDFYRLNEPLWFTNKGDKISLVL